MSGRLFVTDMDTNMVTSVVEALCLKVNSTAMIDNIATEIVSGAEGCLSVDIIAPTIASLVTSLPNWAEEETTFMQNSISRRLLVSQYIEWVG